MTVYSEKLASYVLGLTFDRFDESVIDRSKELILDFLGSAVAGSTVSSSQMIIETISRWGGIEESTIVNNNKKVPSLNAALANGTMGHALEVD
ncbi:hypothetical protein AKJ40_03710, partial [candidate division MSBL1 archaeon SCGC-AAA259M10]